MSRVFSLLLALAVAAQPAQPQLPGLPQARPAADTAAKAGASPQVPATIDPIEIPLRAARALVRVGEIDAVLRLRGPVQDAQRSANRLTDSLRVLTGKQSAVPPQQLTRRAITSLAAEWSRWDVRVRDWERLVRRRVVDLDSLRVELDSAQQLWMRTVARARVEAAPQLTAEAVSVERRIAEQREAVRARQQELLAVEVALSKASETIDEGLAGIGAAYADMRRQLLHTESPSLWRAIADGGWPDLLTAFGSGLEENRTAFTRFVRINRTRVLFHVLVTLLMLIGIRRLRRNASTSVAPPADSGSVLETSDYRWVLAHPGSSTILMAALLTVLLYPTAPMLVYDVALLLSALSVWSLLPSLLPERVVFLARCVFGLMAIDRVAIILVYATPWHRLALLGVAVSGLVLAVRVRRQLRSFDYATRRQQGVRWSQRGSSVAVVLTAIAIAANLVGNVTLALVASAVVVLSCLAILAVVGATVVNGLIAMVIEQLHDDLKILARKGPQILLNVSRLVRLTALVSWIAAALAALLLWDPIKGLVSQVLAFGVSIGKADLTIATVLLFFGIIWFGALLGRWVALVLESDVLDRLSLPHGMPVTIATIVQYALTALAFFLALAATGVNVGQLTIIGGALSVGVGFGLQTIVNNFISGLILAFERPVSIGDTIQLGDMEGVVTKIGIRASVIRISTGADLIVPNGRMLDRDLINWTRSGRHRRIEIPLRVQSGVDPKAIVDIVPGVAARHRHVSASPAPTCLFLGFGPSSADFVLRVWTESDDHRAVSSDISLAAEEALRNAGYSSPFSQHDLHLRSVSADVVAALGHLESTASTPPHPTST